MPIPKALASYFRFATNFRFATFTFMKHESREWVKDKESKSQKDKEAKGPFFETLMFMNLIH